MKDRFYKGWLLAALVLAGAPFTLRAQTYSVPWFVVANGGGIASGGAFAVTGTFGQWDASGEAAIGADLSLTSGFWSFLAAPTALFSDNFAGNSVDPTKWVASGYSVIETNGMMEVLNNAVNNGGVLTSVPFLVNSSGLITISREVFLHAAPSSQSNYPGTYFMGQFAISIGSLPPFSVNYANMDYSDGVTYMARHGFYLARDGASPLYIVDQGNVSPAISPLWDTWFNETITYDPASGVMDYLINNVSQMTYNVGALPPTNAPFMTLGFNAWGWWTGHEQLFENLVVDQTGLPPAAPVIALGSDPAFGGVPVNTSSNQTVIISNIGTSTLTVSNIIVPPGFNASWSGTIPAGGTQAVTVTFSPLVTTNYSGTISVISDAIGGVNAIPVSGYGANESLVLIININGNGVVSPDLNGQTLVAGRKYTVKAVADAGNVLSGWAGSIVTNARSITFTMEKSTLLQASFVPSPFLSNTGTYNGLFSASNGVTEQTAGMLKDLTVNSSGDYSGALMLDGAGHPISGAFSLSGLATNHFGSKSSKEGIVDVVLALDLVDTPAQVTGKVSGTQGKTPWTADLLAIRSAKGLSGYYTMVLAPTEIGIPSVPSGYGYALVTNHSGTLTISGALADGSAVNQTVSVSEAGTVPVYASLYGNTGLLMGWIDMTSGTPVGNLDWIKPAARTGRYRSGFTNVVITQGSGWTNRSPATAINFSSGQLGLSGGMLPKPLIYTVAVTPANALTLVPGGPTNSMSGSINTKTGVLTVTFGNGKGGETTVAKGVVLQDSKNAAGFFLSTTNAGSVILVP